MHLINPPLLGLNKTIIPTAAHTYQLVLSTSIGFSLTNSSILKYSEMFEKLGKLLENTEGGCLDSQFPKERGEVLILGNCEMGTSIPHEISISVGRIDCQAAVFNERFWKKDPDTDRIMIVPGEYLTTVPLSPDSAFGGKDYDANPNGQGYNPKQRLENGEPMVPLPLIENPEFLIKRPEDVPSPLWLSKTPTWFPERIKLAGTFDDDWYKLYHPAMPPDIHPDYYNDAHARLRNPSRQPMFTGEETFYLKGLKSSDIAGFLPPYKTYAFMSKNNRLFKKPGQLDTVIFIPELMIGITIYRSYFDIGADPLGLSVQAAANAFEDIDDPPRSFEHYDRYLARRISGRTTNDELVYENNLSPRSLEMTSPDEEESDLKSMEEMEKRHEELKKWALSQTDEDSRKALKKPLSKELVSPKNQDPRMKSLNQKANKLAKKKIPSNEELENFQQEMMIAGLEMANEQLEEIPEEYRDRVKGPELLPRHPVVLEEEIKTRLNRPYASEMEENLRKFADTGSLPPEMQKQDIREQIEKQIRQIGEGRRRSPEPALQWPRMVRRDTYIFGHAFATQAQEKTSFDELDLAEVLVNKASFTALSLRKTFLENSLFLSCTFKDCDFTQAALTQAKFFNVKFIACTFSDTNLSKTVFTYCHFVDCTFETILAPDVHLEHTRVEGGAAKDCTWYSLTAIGFQLSKTTWKDIMLTEANIAYSKWSEVSLLKATLTKNDLTGSDFMNCVLEDVFFIETLASGIKFKQLDLKKCCAVGEGNNFNETLFLDVQAYQSGFRQTKLEDARFEQSRFIECDFTEAKMTGVYARGIVFTQSVFTGAILHDADLEASHMFRCKARQADFTNADLTRACFYEADLCEAILKDSLLGLTDFRKTEYDLKDRLPAGCFGTKD